MTEVAAMLEASALRVLDARWREEDAPGDDDRTRALSADLSELGLPLVLISEASGGAGLGSAEGLRLIEAMMAHRSLVPLPMPETMLAGYLLDTCGMAVPDGIVTIASRLPGGGIRLSGDAGDWHAHGVAGRVPWGRLADHLVLGASSPDGDMLALVEIAGCGLQDGENLAGEPRSSIDLAAVRVVDARPLPGAADLVLNLGAALRTVQVAAGCRQALALTIEHAGTRSQFGRPVGKFQAVQQNMAVMAGQTAAAAGAAELAVAGAASGGSPLGVALGKARAAAAAGKVAALAHQTVGAIGFTQEHPLHRITKRLLSWRDEFGSEAYWVHRIGSAAIAAGGSQFWPLISATPRYGEAA